MKCKHYKGEGYIVKIINKKIDLCTKCYLELEQDILEQLRVERVCLIKGKK